MSEQSELFPPRKVKQTHPIDAVNEVLEMAYTAMGRIETEVDVLREELEHQHKRLDDARDAALAKAIQESEQSQ